MGGLLGRGHPVGASGVYQVIFALHIIVCFRSIFLQNNPFFHYCFSTDFYSQAAEAVMQMSGNAGDNQVKKNNGSFPNRILTQSIGGAATSVYTHIFEC